jgi:hypothetical protein
VTIDSFADMPMSKTWSRTTEYRLAESVTGNLRLGPILQQAWQCRENGEVEWRTVPTVCLPPKDFIAAAGDTKP